MLHLRTAATAVSALALTAGLSSCTSGTDTAPSSGNPGTDNPGIAVGEPAPNEADQPEQPGSEQPAEDPGDGTGFGKCTADTLSVRVEHHGDEDVARSADLFIANVGTEPCNRSRS